MGIYIKGQEMPETCNDCEFLDLDTFDYDMHAVCGFTSEIVTYDLRHGRNENCPLIEVTEPHGRLIDANALSVENVGRLKEVIDKVAIDLMVENAPTVIEAEGE